MLRAPSVSYQTVLQWNVRVDSGLAPPVPRSLGSKPSLVVAYRFGVYGVPFLVSVSLDATTCFLLSHLVLHAAICVCQVRGRRLANHEIHLAIAGAPLCTRRMII